MTDMPFITLDNVNNLTKEDIIEISKNPCREETIIDMSSLFSARKLFRAEENKIMRIAEAIRDRAIELGYTPSYDEDFHDEDEDFEIKEICFNLHEFMKSVGYNIGMEYGVDYDYCGKENEFWIRSTC